MGFPAFTCLLPVYGRDDAQHLDAALASVAENSVRPALVLVCEDGPLPPELVAVIERHAKNLPIRRVRNDGPRGLHHNLNNALPLVETPWFCRADADDLNAPDRFAVQLQALADAPDLDALGSDLEEFWPDGRTQLKPMPADHAAIVRYAAARNPMNHPTVFLRTEAVMACGGYPHIPRREDYGLWLKMIVAGFRFGNVPRPLVRMRLGEDFHGRRAAGDAVRVELALLRLKLASRMFPPLLATAAFGLRVVALGGAGVSRLAYGRLRGG